MSSRNHHSHWHWPERFIICMTHSYASSLMIPVKKMLMITFQDGKQTISSSFELIFRADQSMDAPSVAARGPLTDLDLETMWQGCPLCLCYFAVLLLYWSRFFFQEAAITTVDFQWMFHYFGTQSTMQGEGWSILMSNSSGRVWSSVSAGLHRLSHPDNLCWATGPLAEIYSYISENISHITFIFDMI